jgi:hypothetical protein
MTNTATLLANRNNPERTLQLLEEGLGEDFRILTDFHAETKNVQWLSRTGMMEGHGWRVAKNFSEARKFAHAKISYRYELDLIHQLRTELLAQKSDFYEAAIDVYTNNIIGILEMPYVMYLCADRCFFGVIAERILKKKGKEARFSEVWKIYKQGHWPVRWNDDGVQIIY